MTERINSEYERPRKELFLALNCLAISTAHIQMRLTAAAKHLRTLFAHDFPVEQRIRFAALIKRLLEDPANEDLPRNASDNEGRRLAAEILSLYLELTLKERAALQNKTNVPDIGENATAA
jgi:hypothetical protein